jgi:hypothetical protein
MSSRCNRYISHPSVDSIPSSVVLNPSPDAIIDQNFSSNLLAF